MGNGIFRGSARGYGLVVGVRCHCGMIFARMIWILESGGVAAWLRLLFKVVL